MLDIILDTVSRHRSSLFLIDAINDRTMNFDEFHRSACSTAKILHELGISRGDRICLVLNNSVEFATLYFACLYLGAVAVSINPQIHKKDIGFILQTSGIKMLLFSPQTRALISQQIFEEGKIHARCLITEAEGKEGYSDNNIPEIHITDRDIHDWRPFKDVDSDDLFTITFTSGTTGLPKGVPHKIKNLLQNALLFNAELGFCPGHRFYHVFSMTYMAGFLNTLLCPFLAGSSVVITKGFDAKTAIDFWSIPSKYAVNTLWVSPSILASLLRIDRNPIGIEFCRKYIDTVCVGTAPLPVKLKQDFEKKYGVTLYESYGLSETLFVTTNSNNLEYIPYSVGKALPGISLQVIDEKGSEVPSGKDGEIWIRTPFIMTGYLDYKTSLPDRSGVHEWFPSGDIGHMNTDGYLFITDRKKDLIIRGGLNISPRAIEDVIITHESIAQVAVIGLPHEFYGEEIIAAVKLKEGFMLETVLTSLNNLCKENLSAYAVPAKFIALNEFPTSTTGKVQKAKLRESLAVQPGMQQG